MAFKELPEEGAVLSVYHQTLIAFNSRCKTLAAAGVRLLVEGVARDLSVLKGKNYTDQGKIVRHRVTGKIHLRDNLEGKINGMRDKGKISKDQAKVLHQLRKLGNDAAHTLDEAPMSLISDCIDVIEHLFKQVYDHPEVLKRLVDRKKPNPNP